MYAEIGWPKQKQRLALGMGWLPYICDWTSSQPTPSYEEVSLCSDYILCNITTYLRQMVSQMVTFNFTSPLLLGDGTRD